MALRPRHGTWAREPRTRTPPSTPPAGWPGAGRMIPATGRRWPAASATGTLRPGTPLTRRLGAWGPDGARRLVVVTADPATLPGKATWYLVTNLARPGGPREEDSLWPAASLAEITRIYGLRHWVEQSYKQVKDELGWADFQVRSDIAIRRHQVLVNCAFCFCWPWLTSQPPPGPPPAGPQRGGTPRQPQQPRTCQPIPPAPSWPHALRAVRSWLTPAITLTRWWQAWSKAPPPAELQHLLDTVSAEQYERNQARLAANRARAESPGAPREGPALLGGLVACGICGHRLQASYEASGQGLTGRYCCQRRHHTYGEPRCQQMAARFLDDHVVAQVLSALAPAALELSVTAAGQAEARRAEVDRIWRQRLERADFACDRARRQYQLAEPENRLVARQLEREWEAALAERAHLGEEYQRYQRARPARLSPAELAAIRALAGDIPALWAAPTTTVADRKRLLRAVIESVQVTADGTTERVHATVTWAGGHQTHADLRRPVARIDQLSYYPALTERIRALAGQGLGSAAIAGQLAAEGFRTPRQHDRFHPGEIQQLIRRLGLRPGLDHDHRTDHGSLGPGQWWLATLAREIGMPAATLFGWLKRGWVTGRQDTRPPYRWIITADPAEVQRLRTLHQLPAGYHNRRRWTDDGITIDTSKDKEPGNHGTGDLRSSH